MRNNSESHFRTIVKTVSWRIWATVITFVVAYLVTKKSSIAIGVCLCDTTFKLFAYYFHERLWNKVNYGRKKLPEYNI